MCDGSHTSEDEDTKVMNYATRTVLDEMIKFEKSVDTQFKEFRSDVDQRFDKVEQSSRLGLICIALTLVGVIASVFGIEVPIFG